MEDQSAFRQTLQRAKQLLNFGSREDDPTKRSARQNTEALERMSGVAEQLRTLVNSEEYKLREQKIPLERGMGEPKLKRGVWDYTEVFTGKTSLGVVFRSVFIAPDSGIQCTADAIRVGDSKAGEVKRLRVYWEMGGWDVVFRGDYPVPERFPSSIGLRGKDMCGSEDVDFIQLTKRHTRLVTKRMNLTDRVSGEVEFLSGNVDKAKSGPIGNVNNIRFEVRRVYKGYSHLLDPLRSGVDYYTEDASIELDAVRRSLESAGRVGIRLSIKQGQGPHVFILQDGGEVKVRGLTGRRGNPVTDFTFPSESLKGDVALEKWFGATERFLRLAKVDTNTGLTIIDKSTTNELRSNLVKKEYT
ncbi:MAG: hypothetical protein Q7S79_00470 [bacterium]|nr:hypothetical protein [bacterium]